MIEREFQKLVSIHGLRGQSVEACRRVLVGGQTAYAVAQQMDLAKSTVGRALARLNRPICTCCGQPMDNK